MRTEPLVERYTKTRAGLLVTISREPKGDSILEREVSIEKPKIQFPLGCAASYEVAFIESLVVCHVLTP